MELSHPFAVLTPTLDGDVLRVLAQADADFTSGEIHRLLNGPSPRGIQNTLRRLTDQGIVMRRPAGRAYLYQLNRQHLAAPYVMGLARLRDELVERLGAEVRSWEVKPVLGVLFGSGARRDHSTDSDIDILLIQPGDAAEDDWDEWTESLAARVTSWTGNDCRILTFSQAHVENRGTNEPVLDDVIREGIPFHGELTWLTSVLNSKRPRRSPGRGRVT